MDLIKISTFVTKKLKFKIFMKLIIYNKYDILFEHQNKKQNKKQNADRLQFKVGGSHKSVEGSTL